MRPIILVDPERCHTCLKCQVRPVCRPRALVQIEPGELPVIEMDRCRGCLVCVPACPFGAVRADDKVTR